ncbi:MAG TPA: phosphoribosyltransferase family protein [Solirubrobacteraceae bacterium]|nr:phosphoribosyltransferase family protein [Solirubrobacteraceae bacterium]
MVFEDRTDAGRRLAAELVGLREEHPLVFGLPRGGIPVAAEVARRLGAPLEVLVVRKLGAPRNRELAVGALAEGGTAIIDRDIAARVGMTGPVLEEALAREERELQRQAWLFRNGLEPADVRGRSVLVVDDGLATGLSDLVAVKALRDRGAGRIVVAAPVGSREAVQVLRTETDGVVCHTIPLRMLGVGRWYEDFSPVSEEQVLALLAASGGPGRAAGDG